MILYLLDMFYTSSEREVAIKLLNQLIYNTTHNGELRTDLTDFNYITLFKKIVYYRNPPSNSDLPTTMGFGESNTNDVGHASAIINTSLEDAQQKAQQEALIREQERAESNAIRQAQRQTNETARRQREANNVAAAQANQKQRESNRQRQAEEAQRQTEEAQRQAEEAVTLATAEAEAKRLSEEEAKRKENEAKAEAKRIGNEAKVEAKRIANENTIEDICNEVSPSANNGSAAPANGTLLQSTNNAQLAPEAQETSTAEAIHALNSLTMPNVSFSSV
jgi:hypothetical protein